MPTNITLNTDDAKAALNLILNKCEYLIRSDTISIRIAGAEREETHKLFNKLLKALYPEVTNDENKYQHYYSGEMADTWITEIKDAELINDLKGEVHKLSDMGLNKKDVIEKIEMPKDLRIILGRYIDRLDKEKIGPKI
jgi:hypothetical protein